MAIYYSVDYSVSRKTPLIYQHIIDKNNKYKCKTVSSAPIENYQQWPSIKPSIIQLADGIFGMGYVSFIHWADSCNGIVVRDDKTNYETIYFQDINDAIKSRLIF